MPHYRVCSAQSRSYCRAQDIEQCDQACDIMFPCNEQPTGPVKLPFKFINQSVARRDPSRSPCLRRFSTVAGNVYGGSTSAFVLTGGGQLYRHEHPQRSPPHDSGHDPAQHKDPSLGGLAGHYDFRETSRRHRRSSVAPIFRAALRTRSRTWGYVGWVPGGPSMWFGAV
jgi:hypothetical protein